MIRDSIQQAVRDRQIVSELAETDNHAALKVARRIDVPWYRCQALARVARYAPHSEFDDRIDEAFAAANAASEAYDRVAVSAWPLRAMIERGQTSRLPELLVKLRSMADVIDHPVSRMDAMGSLLDGVFPAGDPYRRDMFDAYVRACRAANSWKAGRGLAGFALRIAAHEPALARAVLESMRDSRYKRRAMRELGAVQHAEPSRYF